MRKEDKTCPESVTIKRSPEAALISSPERTEKPVTLNVRNGRIGGPCGGWPSAFQYATITSTGNASACSSSRFCKKEHRAWLPSREKMPGQWAVILCMRSRALNHRRAAPQPLLKRLGRHVEPDTVNVRGEIAEKTRRSSGCVHALPNFRIAQIGKIRKQTRTLGWPAQPKFLVYKEFCSDSWAAATAISSRFIITTKGPSIHPPPRTMSS